MARHFISATFDVPWLRAVEVVSLVMLAVVLGAWPSAGRADDVSDVAYAEAPEFAGARVIEDDELSRFRGTGSTFEVSGRDQIGVILWDEWKGGQPSPRSNGTGHATSVNVTYSVRVP